MVTGAVVDVGVGGLGATRPWLQGATGQPSPAGGCTLDMPCSAWQGMEERGEGKAHSSLMSGAVQAKCSLHQCHCP
jgi:hypothetical protein